LRFLAVVTVGWIGARILLLWPQTGSLPDAIRALAPEAHTRDPALPAASPVLPVARAKRPGTARVWRRLPFRAPAISPPPPDIAPVPPPVGYAAAKRPPAPGPSFLSSQAVPVAFDSLTDRWSASGWFVARAGRGIGAAPGGGQLGGGQAGLRIAYRLAPRERIAAFARVTAPLAGTGREAAVGVEWQPGAGSFRLLVEQRFGLDGTPGGTGIGAVAGLDIRMRHFRIEGYGQAGAIARHRVEPYADGAVRVTRALSPVFSLGMGAWGGAQRDAQRLDVGPSATLTLGPARVSLDWRQRIAGRASPGSGLALTLGGDF
jgi:hypothetical protein